MPVEIPTSPEKDKAIDDNDRKFTLPALPLEFLATHSTDSYYMITDWLETNDNDETKIVRKIYDDGEEKLLYITKVGVDEDRESKKTPLTEQAYGAYLENLDPSKPHVEKRRYEFEFAQNGIDFTAKYDEFAGSTLRVLEVDAKTKLDKDKNAFDPTAFDYPLTEVTGIKQFYGYRIASIIHPPAN